MKILMVSEGMDIGGAETHVLTLIRALSERGDKVTLLCAGGRYHDALVREGIRCVVAPTNRRDPISLLKSARALHKLVGEGYDCIHAHTRGMAALARYTTSMPLVVTAHLNFPVGPLRRALASFGDHALAVSQDLADYLVYEYGYDEKSITVTKNGIDATRFQGRLGEEETILHVSRFDRDRSLIATLLCKIAPSLLSKFPKAKIILCGSGNDEKCIQLLVNKANKALNEERVLFLGGRTDIDSILQKGAIFVGVSRAALEAMSAKCAVILAGNDGYGGIMYPESLSYHGRTNFCARGEKIADETRLYQDLSTLLSDRRLVARCACEGRSFIEEHYTPKGMAEDAHLAYTRAIQKKRTQVSLLGFYGYGNFGDELTRRILTERLQHQHVTTLVRFPQRNKGEKNRYLDAMRAVRRGGTLVFGGGNLFQNTTSDRSLLYYTTLLRYAKARGCRTVLLGGGIGDFRTQKGHEKMRRAISCFDRIACRTTSDCHLAKTLGAKDVEYLPDPCFLYTSADAMVTASHDACSKEQGYVLILPRRRYADGRDLFLENTRAVGFRLVFLSLFDKEDASLCGRLAQRYGGEYHRCMNLDELCHLVLHANFTVAERLHGAILSLLCHTPAYLLADSGKARALIEDCERVAQEAGVACPLCSFAYYGELSTSLTGKRKTEGQAFGFSELISYFRSFYGAELSL